MKYQINRLQTPILILLVVLSLWQFTLLMNQSQETYRTVQAPSDPISQNSVSQDPSQLIAPPRMIAHLPNGELALLRSSSAYYQTIWSTILKGSLKTLTVLNRDEMSVVDREIFATDESGIDLILPAPISLKHFCEALQIKLISQDMTDLPMVNRLYISGERDDFLLLEDGENQQLYRLPVASKAEVIFNLLQVTQNSVYYALTTVDLTPYDFVSTNPIYTYRQNPYVAARDSGKPVPLQLDVLASRFFDDTAMIRSFTDVNGAIIYYDGVRTMLLLENQRVFPLLELKQSVEESNAGHAPLMAMTRKLNSMQLWPLTSEYLFDGVEVSEERAESYYTLVSNGRPIYFLEGKEQVRGSLKVESKGEAAGSLSITEPVLGVTQKQFLSLGIGYVLWRVWNQWEVLFPEQTPEEMPLRDIYEGYLLNEEQSQAESVWIIEFYNGSKLFYNMANGDYLGQQVAVKDR